MEAVREEALPAVLVLPSLWEGRKGSGNRTLENLTRCGMRIFDLFYCQKEMPEAVGVDFGFEVAVKISRPEAEEKLRAAGNFGGKIGTVISDERLIKEINLLKRQTGMSVNQIVLGCANLMSLAVRTAEPLFSPKDVPLKFTVTAT